MFFLNAQTNAFHVFPIMRFAQKAERKIFDGITYNETDGIVTYVDTSEGDGGRPLLRMTPGALFAHHDNGHGGGGHGHALKEPLSCKVVNDDQKCFEWPGKYITCFERSGKYSNKKHIITTVFYLCQRYNIYLSRVGKAKLIFSRVQVEDYYGEEVACYNHIWDSMSLEKAPLMDCFASSPKHTHENVVEDGIINVGQTYILTAL